jgi:Phage integrase family
MPIPVETAAGSRDQRQDVFGSGSPCASGTVRWTGEVAAEKILLPLEADGGSAHTPWHRVRGSTGTCRGAVSCDLRLALLAGGGRSGLHGIERRWAEAGELAEVGQVGGQIAAAGLSEDFHFHDLRHTGNQLAARSGASTRELMRRMGHSTVRAALIYQHATDDRDQAIAKALNALIEAEKLAGGDADRTEGGGG